MNRKDRTILEKMKKYCLRIKGLHQQFEQNKDLFTDEERGYAYRDSVAMSILQIGELAKALSKDFIDEYTEIPWKPILRMRDLLAHHYGNLDYKGGMPHLPISSLLGYRQICSRPSRSMAYFYHKSSATLFKNRRDNGKSERASREYIRDRDSPVNLAPWILKPRKIFGKNREIPGIFLRFCPQKRGFKKYTF